MATQFLIIAVVIWSFCSVMLFNDPSVYGENNLLENTQVLTLLLTLILFTLPILDRFRNDRLLSIFFSFLALGFILRELDVEKFDLPSIMITLGSGEGRNIILAIGVLSTLAYALFKFRYYLDLAICFIRGRTGFATLAAGLFLVIGDIFENFQIQHHILYEESFELVGYSVLLMAASRLARREVKTSRFIR